ncbi:STAS domain-containing protein [Saccharopolyspora phatthalungensis]|uniref:Anti-sigma factor antagonist n=1 Tax=Saccharopolyspora phatthalungensis TaxID=664693 RepID=A0A840QFC8_9PSEU|nr:anti-anti-sigma factor [Saccharopolyspora phatthalungensis]
MDLELTNVGLPDGITLIEVTGEIDVYTAPSLRERLIDAVNGGEFRLIADLTGVDFMDSTGLGVLVGGLKRTRAQGGALVLVCRAERLLKIFRITGLTKVFQIVPDVLSARALFADPEGLAAPPTPDAENVGWHWVPGRIYLSDERDSRSVEDATQRLLDAFGLECVYSFPPVIGSWFGEFLIRLKNSGQLPTKEEQFVKLSRALDLRLLDRQQAEVDAAQGAAVAGLIRSLQHTPRAVVQVGSVLLVKVDDVIVVRNLTQVELAYWERNPALFRDPAAALLELQQANSGAAEVVASASDHEHASAADHTNAR